VGRDSNGGTGLENDDMRAFGCLIVAAAMIGGGYLATQILGCFFVNPTGEWDPMTVVLWIVIIPPAAIFSGMIATLLTPKAWKGKPRKHPPVAA
jgi:hypothetical protein